MCMFMCLFTDVYVYTLFWPLYTNTNIQHPFAMHVLDRTFTTHSSRRHETEMASQHADLQRRQNEIADVKSQIAAWHQKYEAGLKSARQEEQTKAQVSVTAVEARASEVMRQRDNAQAKARELEEQLTKEKASLDAYQQKIARLVALLRAYIVS